MPTYEYRCLTCAAKTVITRSLNEDEVTPECCSNSMARIYSAPTVTFNGTGWGKD